MLRQTISRLLPPLGFALALFCTPHCAQQEPGAKVDAKKEEVAVEDGVVLSAATWTLDWTTDGVEFDAAGGFSLTTNLGYRVHIETGQLVMHRVALIPCPAKPADTTTFLSLSIASAYAHEENADPSSMETLTVTDVVHPKTREIGANAFAPVRYCQVYWLVARGMDGATSTDGLDMSNRSIYFKGTWERNGESGPLLVDTWWPMGVIADMKSIVEPTIYSAAGADSSVHFVWVDLDIAMGKLFDDIEFGVDSEAIVADSMLDNIVANTQLTVDLQSP